MEHNKDKYQVIGETGIVICRSGLWNSRHRFGKTCRIVMYKKSMAIILMLLCRIQVAFFKICGLEGILSLVSH